MRKVFLYRDFEAENLKPEIVAAKNAGFTVLQDREDLRKGDVVLPRFYPFYNYLVDELASKGAALANTQHDWVSDIRAWAPVLGELTPRTWTSIEDVVASGFTGPFFVKGIDKSLKVDFNEFCYAADLDRLPIVLENLKKALPVEQPLVIREFIPLTTYGISPVSGMPVAHEFRVFIYDGKILSDGFYWESVREKDKLTLVDAPSYGGFIQQVVDVVGERCKFYALDIALTAEGEWIVIELNDGCLSGLSANDPTRLYEGLFAAL